MKNTPCYAPHICSHTHSRRMEPESMGWLCKAPGALLSTHSAHRECSLRLKPSRTPRASAFPEEQTNSESWKHTSRGEETRARIHSLENVQNLQGLGFSSKTQDEMCERAEQWVRPATPSQEAETRQNPRTAELQKQVSKHLGRGDGSLVKATC